MFENMVEHLPPACEALEIIRLAGPTAKSENDALWQARRQTDNTFLPIALCASSDIDILAVYSSFLVGSSTASVIPDLGSSEPLPGVGFCAEASAAGAGDSFVGDARAGDKGAARGTSPVAGDVIGFVSSVVSIDASGCVGSRAGSAASSIVVSSS